MYFVEVYKCAIFNEQLIAEIIGRFFIIECHCTQSEQVVKEYNLIQDGIIVLCHC